MQAVSIISASVEVSYYMRRCYVEKSNAVNMKALHCSESVYDTVGYIVTGQWSTLLSPCLDKVLCKRNLGYSCEWTNGNKNTPSEQDNITS